MTIGEKIRKIRESTGLSGRAFACRCNMSHTQLLRVENGQCAPSYDLLSKLVSEFTASPAWLLTNSGESMTMIPGKIDLELMRKTLMMVDEEKPDASSELRAQLAIELYKSCILNNLHAPKPDDLHTIIQMVS